MEYHFGRISKLLLAALLLSMVVACSTQKNTAGSRWWHSFNARYNTYYNGSVAYIDGSLEKEQGNKDNFTELLPLYTVGNKQSRELGKANFDRAIEKSKKAIKQHSIKRRPVWDKKRRKTAKDREWLSRKEYNPFLWKAWLLMGRAQFHKGDFDEAASTFAYMSRLYRTQPSIYGRARAWLAKSYIENGWMYDAEDVIRNMRRDSIHWRARKEWDYTLCDYYLHLGDYEQAIPYLRKVIKHEMRRRQKAREWYLLGQLYELTGNNQLAYKAYRHVGRLNPPYEVEFNARIAMTEVMGATQGKKMIGKLRRMAASDNNKDYLDQIYYAIGNLYLLQRDTLSAITAYEKGNKGSTRNGIEKGVLLLRLGDIYWNRERYADAQRCYGEAIGLLDKDRKDYEQLSERSKVLDELVPYTSAIELQDSLQGLAKMSEKDRNAAIDRVIDTLKEKEKEEAKLKAEQEVENRDDGGNEDLMPGRQTNQNTAQNNNQQQLWYFYNPMAVSQGKAEFRRRWGNRENADDWQRKNKTVVAMGEMPTDEQPADSLTEEGEPEEQEQKADSAALDPHSREYYLAQIPFTPEQVQASNAIIMDGLFHSGVIFKDKLDNLTLAEKAFSRLTSQYPQYEHMDEAYYHLFLLYSRRGLPAVAQSYVSKLKAEYPKSSWTTLLTDPNFANNARFGVELEDSLYAATYEAFKADRYTEVAHNVKVSNDHFPLGANRDKFLFIGGLGKLNSGDADGCLADMRLVVERYPKSRLAEMAGMIVNGVKGGRKLRGGRFDMGDVWQRRSIALNDSDSIAARTFSNERNTNFCVLIVYKPDTLDENKLLYQLAKYNFTSYLVRDFGIETEDAEGLHRMKVAGFRNYDEALQYARQLHQQKTLAEYLRRGRTIVISEENLPLLGQQYSYDDYDRFYSKHFAPLRVSTFMLLTEPAEIVTEPQQPTQKQIDDLLDDGTFIDNGLDDGTGEPTGGGIIIPEEKPALEQNDNAGGTIIPDEKPAAKTETEETGGIVIPDEKPAETKPAEKKAETAPAKKAETTQEKKAKTAPTKKAETKPAVKPSEKTEEPKKPAKKEKLNEDVIYFGDDIPEEPKNDKKKEKKKKEIDFEDEYYDLEGF